MLEIRAYRPDVDTEGVRACLVELQDHERTFEPALTEGAAMADAHLALLIDRCLDWDGCMFVALDGAHVVGVVCVWARVPPDGPDDVPTDHAYVADLAVLATHRGRGIGRALLERAEAFARRRGSTTLRVGVRSRNQAARGLYASAGFAEDRLELVKPLTGLDVRRVRSGRRSGW
jgi:ribosomal protein S18 acetylase RimI-like enzyme